MPLQTSNALFSLLLAAALFLAPAVMPQAAANSGPGSDWKLVFSDEFDHDGLPDPAKWTYEEGFFRNSEAQYYTAGQMENARVENGLLIIEAHRKKNLPNPNYVNGSSNWTEYRKYIDYTSASLITKGKHSWTYGRFEARMKIDTRLGSWPAFWTLGTTMRAGLDPKKLNDWPFCGEIDIMEFYNAKGLLANVYWATKHPNQKDWQGSLQPLRATGPSSKRPVAEMIEKTGNPKWADEFHVWRMDWDRDSLKLSVDGIPLNEIKVEDATYKNLEEVSLKRFVDDITLKEIKVEDVNDKWNEDKFNPFRAPHYIILNQAIGGTQGGDPKDTEFPVRLEVDYIRVYQRAE